MKKQVSELRKDMVSEDWVLVASSRGRRPHSFDGKKKSWKKASKKGCPFEDPQKSGNGKPIVWYEAPKKKKDKKKKRALKDWFLQVIPNKFPALAPSKSCPVINTKGSYETMRGVGFHEVVITRPHLRSLGEMSYDEAELVLRAYQERMNSLKKEKCVEYIAVFHNHGEGAGASLAHPHSQIAALPIVPTDISRSLNGSQRYFDKNGHCVHCTMLEREIKEKKRIIYQNKYFVVVAPFASRISYEVRVFPKWHDAHFEEMDENNRILLAEALVQALRRLGKTLNDPDYNFFIHTAPIKAKHMEHYHWHFEILPKTAIWAGLEIGTGIEVVSTSPEDAARELRKA